MIQAAEQRLSCRPRRRAELAQERLADLEKQIECHGSHLERQEQAHQQEQECQDALRRRLAAHEKHLTDLETQWGSEPVRPYSRLAKARQQREGWQGQLVRSQRRDEIIQRKIERYQTSMAQLRLQQAELGRWHATLLSDNAENLNPAPICIHLDGGFSGGSNLGYLIELGYDVLAAGKGKVTSALRQQLPAQAKWEQGTSQVQLWEAPAARAGTCPYPMRRILQHWQAGERERFSSFLQYPAGSTMTLSEVFNAYHRRQHVEAGIKQGKSVFGGRGVRIRSAAGLELLNQFAFVFWPNFVHWATDWLNSRVNQSSRPFEAAMATVKTQVRVAAQTPARMITAPGCRILVFSEEGPYPNVHLNLDGIYAFQLPLPLYQCPLPERMIQRSPRRLLSPPDG